MELELKHVWYAWAIMMVFTILVSFAGYVWNSVFFVMLFGTFSLIFNCAVIILIYLWWKENWRNL